MKNKKVKSLNIKNSDYENYDEKMSNKFVLFIFSYFPFIFNFIFLFLIFHNYSFVDSVRTSVLPLLLLNLPILPGSSFPGLAIVLGRGLGMADTDIGLG